ncbi:hypothetical protein NECAME_03307 [Necator americanus]|uniref:Uncharacterized protein n=1 Tax=Necator americanus TaxID=51031 RepID=W2T4S2_NECAM|nr:hypothetical protein NECAME_03307 [Necator americanus]ETN76878.1 hypothetical protein NECAME_03307 [Necator americanus]
MGLCSSKKRYTTELSDEEVAAIREVWISNVHTVPGTFYHYLNAIDLENVFLDRLFTIVRVLSSCVLSSNC